MTLMETDVPLMKKVDSKTVWFRHEEDLNNLDVENCIIDYGKIEDPYFGRGGPDSAFLGLHFTINTSQGTTSNFSMYKPEEIDEFLYQLKSSRVEEIDEMIIQLIKSEPYKTTAISVNQNLV